MQFVLRIRIGNGWSVAWPKARDVTTSSTGGGSRGRMGMSTLSCRSLLRMTMRNLQRTDCQTNMNRLTPAMAMKHGFKTVSEYKEGVQKKFSLLETGIIHQPSCRLLLVNGTLDGLMPIEDSMMLFEYGSPKEAR